MFAIARRRPHGLRRINPVLRQFGAASVLFCSATAFAQVQFEDVTDGSGVEYTGESYGASWGDMNGDRWPDLMVTHHRNPSGLYVNRADGTFENRAFEIDAWQLTPRSDVHGGTWADFDNDGDADLVITAGSKNATQFLVNNGQFLTDRVADFSFDRMNWGGRFPFWFDYNNDGLLDLGVVVQGDKIQLHEQVNGDFERRNAASGHECDNGDYALLSDLTLDGRVDWVCVNSSAVPEYVYDFTVGVPFLDRSDLAQSVASIADVAIADFDGDQIMELFALRGKVRVNGGAIVGPNSVEAHLTNTGSSTSGVSFRSTGDLAGEIHWSGPNANNVFIGAGGLHPPFAGNGEPIRFNLSAADPDVHGLMPFDPATDRGIFVGYDPATQTWSYHNSAGAADGGSFSYTYTYLDTTAPVSNLVEHGIPANERPRQPALIRYNGSQYTNQVAGSGLDHAVLCNAVAAADFDNDMDVDLFYVCRGGVLNLADRLYLNDGTGRFSPAAAPFGAEGPTGAGVGLGENVVASDFDVDGFVDLFVTNGLKLYPLLAGYDAGGPDKLFRNLGNGSNWIELDLTGVTSNRDGIGAIVTATAGGITQRRERNGGYHRWAQHDNRIHFGLAQNAAASITVQWPSGQTDTYTNVAANALYEVIEGNPQIFPVDLPDATDPSACATTGGMPDFNPSADRALFIWRDDCASQDWKVRVTGGNGPTITYAGAVPSDLPLTNVAGFRLENSDTLEVAPDGSSINYSLIVAAGGQDGFDFTRDAAANTCFGVGSNVATALAGSMRTPLSVPFDMRTFGPCADQEIRVSIDDVTVAENTPGGAASFAVTLSGPASETVRVDFTTQDGTAAAGSDYVGSTGVVEFPPGTTSQALDILLIDDAAPEPVEEFTVELADPSGASLGDFIGTATVLDDEPSPCGAPAYDRATEHALFVWQDCGTGEWFVRVTAGGQNATFTGEVAASEAFADVSGFSIEGSDELDATTDPAIIDFALIVGNAGQDGFDFVVAPGATACLDLAAPSVPVLVGANRTPVAMPLDLATLGPCVDGDDEAPLTGWAGATGGVSAVGNAITYSGTPTGWAANTVISPALATLGYGDNFEVRFTIGSDPAGTTWVVGLGVSETGANWRDIDYGLRSSGGELKVYENGDWRTTVADLAVGDAVSIRVTPGVIEYRLNDVTFYSTSYAGSPNFYVDTSFNAGAIELSVTVVGTSGDALQATSIDEWARTAGGVSVSGPDVSYSGAPEGWASTAVSGPLSDFGATEAYAVRWVIDGDPDATTWVLGLGTAEESDNWRDVDYAIRSSNGLLQAYESGTWAATAVPLAAGDELSLHVDGADLHYRLNGATFHSTAIDGGEDFYIDSSFKQGAIDLVDVTLIEF